MNGTPTQVAHRVRASFRTAVQALVGAGVTAVLGWLAGRGFNMLDAAADVTTLVTLGVFAAATWAVTWLTNLPAVNRFIERVTPFLATGVHTEPGNDGAVVDIGSGL